MATPFPISVTAAQVGTYFVGQYYQVLQQQPDLAFQFYSDSSTMLRIDGSFRETATAMLQIHAVIMSLGYTGIEIKTVNALESWNGGVNVMVSGSVQLKNFIRRKFMETFFLAPQEKGYFVLNDIFHYADEEAILHHPTLLLPQSSLVSKINASTTIQDTVPNYMLGGEIQARDFAAPVVKENGVVPNYSLIEQQTQEVCGTENIVVDNAVEESNPHQNTMNVPQDSLSASAVEPIGEPQKHTYASILLVAKGQSPPSAAPSISVNKNNPIVLEQNHILPTTTQQSVTSSHEFEMDETIEELPLIEEDEGEIKSVYVRNLPPTVSVSDVEEEFKHFGKLSSDGVVIRSRKDVGVCYAFVEFEEVSGVQNAIKAGTAQVAGRQVYIEERRPNSNIPSRGGRGRGRGRGSYQLEASRSRFPSRSYMQGGISNGSDRDFTRPRGNGLYRPTIRHDRVIRSTSHQEMERISQTQHEYSF